MQGSVVIEILGGMIGWSLIILVLGVLITLIQDFSLFDVIHEEFDNLSAVLGGDVVRIFVSIFVIVFLVFIGRWLLSFLGSDAGRSANK